jgi:hypothetical protein
MPLFSNGIRVKRSVSALFLLLHMVFCSQLQALEQEFYPNSNSDQAKASDHAQEKSTVMPFTDYPVVLCRFNPLRGINIDNLVSCQLSSDGSTAIVSLRSGYELIEVKSASVDMHYWGILNGKHLVRLPLNRVLSVSVLISNLKNQRSVYDLQFE